MNITIVTGDINGGGAERVVVVIANSFVSMGWSVRLIVLNPIEYPLHYDLNPKIVIEELAITNKIRNKVFSFNNFEKILKLRKSILNSCPDIVLSFINQVNVAVLCSLLFTNIKVIVTEETDPAQHNIGRIWDILRIIFYLRANAITVKINKYKDFFWNIPSSRIFVIPNPIMNPVKTKENYNDCFYKIVAIGRLSKEKGFDKLIKAFNLLDKKYEQWKLSIYGAGLEQEALQQLIDHNSLQDRVILEGWKKEIYDIFLEADIYILSSSFEGFGLSLCEAMSAGMPVISFDCPSGPGEIIQHGENGFLVPPGDIEKLTETIQYLLDNQKVRGYIGENAKKILLRYGLNEVMRIWQELILQIVNKQ